MAKSIGFNITLNVNGKDTIVKCKADAQNLSRALGQVKSQSDIARSSVVKWSAASTATKNAYEGFSQVANAMTSYIYGGKSLFPGISVGNFQFHKGSIKTRPSMIYCTKLYSNE